MLAALYVLSLVAAVLLTIYLIVALLKPEIFA